MFLKTLQEMQRLMVHAIKVAKQLPLSDPPRFVFISSTAGATSEAEVADNRQQHRKSAAT